VPLTADGVVTPEYEKTINFVHLTCGSVFESWERPV
jgi:hypothetical protein